MDTKYIVYHDGISEVMVIFGELAKHSVIANGIDMDVISAGFLMISYGGVTSLDKSIRVTCYGKSTSLNIESRPKEDGVLAKITLGLNRCR